METSTMINNLNNLFELLNFETLSSINDSDFKKLILDFFLEIEKLKDDGLELNVDLKKFIDNKHIQYYDYYEKSLMYEERMQTILSELIGFCSPPKFWNTPFDEYILKKWDITIE